MPTFSPTSLARLSTCHPDLRRLFTAVIEEVDCTVLCGYRDKEEQEKAFADGTSDAHFGQSPHNVKPSRAVDVIPYPLKSWKDLDAFRRLAEVVKRKADELGIKVKHGAEFKKLPDWPHWELDK